MDALGTTEPLLGFVEISEGRFWMGSEKSVRSSTSTAPIPVDLQAYEDETPPHELDLPTYYLSRYPVTVAQFRAFLRDTKALASDRYATRGVPNHPAVLVSFGEALLYCQWLTGKLRHWPGTPEPLVARLRNMTDHPGRWRVTLPTEVEWEKAARGAHWEHLSVGQ